MKTTLIIDADDTLWETEIFYEQCIASFGEMMAMHGHDREEAERTVDEVERERVPLVGYGPQEFSVNLAIAYYEAGETAKAADAAREALLYDESLAPAHTVLGAMALASRQPEKALAHLQQAITLDAGYGQAHFYLGLAYKSVAQPADAIAAFEQALVVADEEVMRVRIRRHLNELYEEERRRKSP